MKPIASFLSILLLAGLLAATPTQAQEAGALIMDGKTLLQEGYDVRDLDRLQRARALFERAAQDETHAALAHYYAALAEQRTVNLLWSQEEDRAATHLDAALEHARQAAEEREDWAEVHLLLANLYGQKSSLNPLKGMIYGPRADREWNRAHSLAPENPRVALIRGINLYHKPRMFGGSKEEALASFQEATRLFEAGPDTPGDSLAPAWGHDEAYAWIGIAHMEMGNETAAREAFEKALAVNPDFGRVKHDLLPQLDQAQETQ